MRKLRELDLILVNNHHPLAEVLKFLHLLLSGTTRKVLTVESSEESVPHRDYTFQKHCTSGGSPPCIRITLQLIYYRDKPFLLIAPQKCKGLL